MAEKLTLMGAGGKMGCRIVDQIRDDSAYNVSYVEPGEEGQERLAERGISADPVDEALEETDFVIMAVPDHLLGPISDDVVPAIPSGAMVVLLDPAAAHAGALHEREDIAYFIAHPSHPSLFTAETEMDDDDPDWFGGQGRDVQDIVCALHQGDETDYERGEAIARDVYSPVRNAHKVTTDQMAWLEPALVESVLGTALYVIQEGYEEVVENGVPEQAARDFLFGHLRIELGIIFGYTDFPFSDGAQEAIAHARDEMLQQDWKESIFSERAIKESTSRIAEPEQQS